jgi:DNA polymerase sigma
MFAQAKYIFQAKIPVIKLKANEKYKLKKIDITMIDENHNGIKCVDLILQYINRYPMIKPIFMVLKQLFFIVDLNDPSQVDL